MYRVAQVSCYYSSTALLYYCCTTAVQLRYHCSTTVLPLHYNCTATVPTTLVFSVFYRFKTPNPAQIQTKPQETEKSGNHTLCFPRFKFCGGCHIFCFRFGFGFPCCRAFRFGFRFGFQVPVSESVSDALRFRFAFRRRC